MDYEKIYNECIAAGESEVHELPEPTAPETKSDENLTIEN